MNNLPSLKVNVIAKVDGSNLPVVAEAVTKFVESINTELNLDADFVQAKEDVKTLKGLEDGLKDAKATLLAQTEELNRHLIAIDELAEVPRQKRLFLSPEIKSRESEVKSLAVKGYTEQAIKFIAEVRAGHKHYYEMPVFDPSPRLKGLKTIESYVKRLAECLDTYRDEVGHLCDLLHGKEAMFSSFAEGYDHLFPDAARLIQQTDMGMIKDIVNARITTAKQAEEARKAEDARLAEAVEAPKGVELPKFETVETVDEETGEVAEVKREIEMVSLPKLRLLQVLRDVSCVLLDCDKEGGKEYKDIQKLINHIKGIK